MANAVTVKVDKTKKEIVITVPLQEPAPSASGKTLVVGTTRGNVQTETLIDGKPVFVGVNAYIKKN